MRRRAVVAVMALMVGVIGVFMGGEEGRHFMMPGKLSSHHAGLTDCSTCHSGAQSGQVDLLHRLMTAVEPRQNSNLCLKCHVMGAEPFAPHTHAVEDLARRTETLRLASKNWKPESLAQRIVFPVTVKSQGALAEIQCATCHKEHQGVFANLKAVSNQRCQTCHVSRFDAFADSHPQFVKFPYLRRPRIAFDHQSHMAKYFPEATKAATRGQVVPDNCADCHQVGVRQRYMQVKPFVIVCASCHNGDITGATQVSGPKGIDVLTVPGLDVATLSQRGFDIGNWPEKSEAVLTPFMRLLLDSEGDGVASGVTGLDLLDLRNANDQELERVARLAWAVKRLFNGLETTNPSSAKLLTGDTFGALIDHDQMAALTGGMSHDVIMAGNREWFPGLQEELLRHDRGETIRKAIPVAKPVTDVPNPPPIANPANAGAKPTGADILGGKAEGKKDDILGSGGSSAAEKNDDILSKDNDKSDILASPKQDDILATSKDDILSEKPAADNVLSGGDDTDAKGGQSKKGAEAKKSADAIPQFDPEIWAQTGGWYRQDFAIRYRPTGHADQFLQIWLDFSGAGYGSGLHNQLAPIFDMLSLKDTVGRCTKCHSVDDREHEKSVNWLAFDPNALKNRFTNYSHKPHVELIGAKTCAKCHELRSARTEFMKTYDAGNPTNYTPNFKPQDKAVCASCHSQQTAWENCTLCHGYHVPDAATKSSKQVFPAVSEKPMQLASEKPMPRAKNAALFSPDAESDTEREYAMAEAVGTEEAWGAFATRHSSGRYHDLAMSELAKLKVAGKSAPLSDTVPIMESNKQDSGGPREPPAVETSTSVPPDAPKQAVPDETMRAALSEKLTGAVSETKSAESLERVGDGEPTDLEGFLRRGHDRAVRGDFDLARQDFDEVIRRDPGHAAALDDRCWVLALLDEVRAALEDCNASLQVAPNFADALDSRGFVNLKLGLYRKAIADYTAALSHLRGVKRASALYGRGIAKLRIGILGGANADMRAARTLKPTIVDEFASYGIR